MFTPRLLWYTQEAHVPWAIFGPCPAAAIDSGAHSGGWTLSCNPCQFRGHQEEGNPHPAKRTDHTRLGKRSGGKSEVNSLLYRLKLWLVVTTTRWRPIYPKCADKDPRPTPEPECSPDASGFPEQQPRHRARERENAELEPGCPDIIQCEPRRRINA